jgi:predicted metalloprotease with PDZ domain
MHVLSTAPPRIRIDVQLPSETNTLSFINTYGGVIGLGERIDAVAGIRADGESLRLEKLAPGEYRGEQNYSRFSYEVSLEKPSRPAQMSHVSWLGRDVGVFMMADLLPQLPGPPDKGRRAQIKLDVPAGWTVTSNVREEGPIFFTNNTETTVFLIGTSVHKANPQLANGKLSILTSGKWPFSISAATKIGAKILDEYLQVTGFRLKADPVLMLLPYEGEVGPDNWSAETRGNVVVLLIGRKAGGKKVLSRLGLVLSHELFHLWVPNSLDLAGNYDWFFEGFTLYRALETDLRLGLISFDDYLETVARVYDSYLASAERDRLSLLEASERRWTTSSSIVYEKGMLVAFVYDLLVKKATGCEASVNDVYAELFRLPATRQGTANETIIRLLSKRDELKTFAEDYLIAASRINPEEIFAAYGLQLQSTPSGATVLTVKRNSNETQQRLLACLGYHN